MRAEHVDELVADPRHGVERVHRALEDERDVAPAEAAQLGGTQADELAALEDDLSADDPPRRAQHLQDRVRNGALAAPGFPCESHDLPWPHGERDPVDGRDRTLTRAVGDDQIPELEQRAAEPRWHVRAADLRHASSRGAPWPEETADEARPLFLYPQTRIGELVDAVVDEHHRH